MLAHRVSLEFKKCAFRRNASWKKSCGTWQQHEKKSHERQIGSEIGNLCLDVSPVMASLSSSR